MQEPRGVSLKLGYSTDLSVPTCRKQEHHRPGLRHQERIAGTVRLVPPPEEPAENAARRAPVFIGGTGRRRGECATGDPERTWILLEVVGDSRSGEREHCVFLSDFLKMTTVDEHEYYKMMWMREARIRTFIQLELEPCLEEASWMIRCHNCEALNRPQEEYPARLLPTPPPGYIDNLQRRLIKARKGIFPASLKMILKTNYPLTVRRPAPETSVQPDDVMGEHRAGENSASSQCDPSPRRAAVDTGSEEPGTPPRSPAIGTGSGPGVSQPETQIMEE